MIVPIIDLRILYHLKTRSIEKHTIVIVLDVSQQKRIGMIVSSVTGVITLTKEQIEPVTSYGSMVHQSQVQGIGILDNRLITILDPEKILQHHQINVDNI
jgi:purine-binding chemotaxis protein CheW